MSWFVKTHAQGYKRTRVNHAQGPWGAACHWAPTLCKVVLMLLEQGSANTGRWARWALELRMCSCLHMVGKKSERLVFHDP